MNFDRIISTQELSENYAPMGWVLLDCRTDLLNPEWGFTSFTESHIPGSIYADLVKDLSGPITLQSGRHPLPNPEDFARKISKWGIQPGTQVVGIDTANGTYAARIWWMLRAIGHSQVAVLDGGFLKWLSESRPFETGNHSSIPANHIFPPRFAAAPFKTTAEVRNNLTDRKVLLMDARAPERFRGEIEPIDTIAGHIPGSVNRPTADNLTPDGTLKPPEVLRTEYLLLLEGVPPELVTMYCGSGVTSCHNLLAMEVAGLPGASLYPGSWSEWIRDPLNPVSSFQQIT